MYLECFILAVRTPASVSQAVEAERADVSISPVVEPTGLVDEKDGYH